MTGRDKSVLNGITSVLLPFLAYYVAHDLASVFLAFLTGWSLAGFGAGYRHFMEAHAGAVDGVRNGLALCIGAWAVWPMARKELWPEGERQGICGIWLGGHGEKPKRKVKRLECFLFLLCAVSLAVGMNILLAFLGVTEMSKNYTDISARQYSVGFGLGLILYGAVSPLAEELVFRGLIYRRMKRCLKTRQAVLLCGLLFGAYHGNLVQGIYGCVLGVAITAAYEWYGGMWAPVLFHGAANVGVFAVSYDAERFRKMATPYACALWLAIAVGAAGVLLFWSRKKG